ncbi:MAG: tRNA lysidine(34) synthetase TilS [Deltaproteobacteria bacterium]|nr:tRNA lysidine(34) synthetase TilS [Deltaproteobacteria bacterium]
MDTIRDIIRKVECTIQRKQMIEHGDLVVVGVSGGPDSICMLDILHEISGRLGIGLFVAHFNHGLRPAEDDSETRLVEMMANSMGLPFKSGKSEYAGNGMSIVNEETARNARYNFLEKVRKDAGADKISMAHNINDQAETVIMRLLRGCGISGLSGIPPVRNRIMRPLIEITREEIELYLIKRGLPFAVDSSNRDKKFLRNRIRMDLIPVLQEYQPRIVEHLGRLSDLLKKEDSFIESKAEELVDKEARLDAAGHISVPVLWCRDLPVVLRNRVARILISKVCDGLRKIDSRHIRSISVLTESDNPQGVIHLPDKLIVKKVYDRLCFYKDMGKETHEFDYILSNQGVFNLERIQCAIKIDIEDGNMDSFKKDTRDVAFLDADKALFPLNIRNFRKGDRFIPLGMKGRRKVKDFFIDLKLPLSERAKVPLLISGDRIAWVCGYRIDDRFKITADTKKILRFEMTSCVKGFSNP